LRGRLIFVPTATSRSPSLYARACKGADIIKDKFPLIFSFGRGREDISAVGMGRDVRERAVEGGGELTCFANVPQLERTEAGQSWPWL